MTDHKKAAQDDMIAANQFEWDANNPGYWLAQAQVQATLCLAEQQAKTAEQARIANILFFHSVAAQIDMPLSAREEVKKGLNR